MRFHAQARTNSKEITIRSLDYRSSVVGVEESFVAEKVIVDIQLARLLVRQLVVSEEEKYIWIFSYT